MKLHSFPKDPDTVAKTAEALRHLRDYPDASEIRPCMSCDVPCECSGSLTCGCGCNVDCEHAPKNLSSDPETFSIEIGIYPLVYAFACLGLCPPFWSCEGHLDQSGNISRIPRVWFYARDLSYPRLIQDHVAGLAAAKKLTYQWHVCVTHSDLDNIDTAFSLEPNVVMSEALDLSLLHSDIKTIAIDFVPNIKLLADKLAENI